MHDHQTVLAGESESSRSSASRRALLLFFAICFAAAGLPYVAPILSESDLAWFGRFLAEALVIAPVTMILLERTLTSRTRIDRAFWGPLAFGMAAWLSVWVLFPVLESRWDDIWVVLVVEFLYLVWYGAFFAAAVQHDESAAEGRRHELVALEKTGLVVGAATLLAAFVLAPQLVSPERSIALVPSYMIYQLLDWTLIVLYGALVLRVRSSHWRRTLGLVFGALLAWGLLDLIEAWVQITSRVQVGESIINVFWLVPYPFLVAAAWSHGRLPSNPVVPSVARGEPRLSAVYPTVTPLLAATLIAFVHLAAEILGVFPAETLMARSASMAAGLLVLAVIAWQHHVVTELHWRELVDEVLRAQKLAAVSSLAGGLAHDLRNLTTVITGNCDLLEQQLRKQEPCDEELEGIRAAARDSHELMQRLLTLGRSQESRVERLDLNALVLRTCGALKPLVGKSIELRPVLEPELPAVLGDSGRLEQVILNLVLNARDAVPDGGRITVLTERREAPELSPGKAGHGEAVVLSVIDTGTGIDREQLQVIFEPYFTTKEAGKGTGLGLSTVQTIVADHRGRLEVDSKPGEGSVFRVLLPVDP